MVPSRFFNILEPIQEGRPSKPDIIIVPLLGFDLKGNRIGYGGGYYDRTLQNFKGPRIGVAFEFQRMQQVPTDENDIKLTHLVSELQLYQF